MGAPSYRRVEQNGFLRLRPQCAGRSDREAGAGRVEGAQGTDEGGKVGMKHTPLDTAHRALGARMMEFGGWEMPVFYSSIMEEHQAVRATAGLFDISHMGEIHATGDAALEFLNGVLANDLGKLRPGQGQYTFLCNARGGVIDDLYAYCLDAGEFLLVVNAGRIEADVAWLEKQLAVFSNRGRLELKNLSDDFGAVAVQGPQAAQFMDACVEAREIAASSLRKNEIVRATFGGQTVFVSRTGYTGEDGFEVVAPDEVTEALWNKILEAGRPFGLKPAGLGARDTLRTEAGYPLYGHELDEETTPLSYTHLRAHETGRNLVCRLLLEK